MEDGEGDTPYADGLDTFPDESDVSDDDTLADRWDTGSVGDFTGLKLKDDHANRPEPERLAAAWLTALKFLDCVQKL